MDSPSRVTETFVDNAQSRELAGGVSQRTIDRWTAAGQFPRPFAISGGLKRRRLSEILTWRDARTAARDLDTETM